MPQQSLSLLSLRQWWWLCEGGREGGRRQAVRTGGELCIGSVDGGNKWKKALQYRYYYLLQLSGSAQSLCRLLGGSKLVDSSGTRYPDIL
jgi:hypothetical protein